MRALLACGVVALSAAAALAHGGAYVDPPGGGDGPQAGPGFGDPPPAPGVSRWETWWAETREDVLRIAERCDAAERPVVTPARGGAEAPPDPAAMRAAAAARVRDDVFWHLNHALFDDDFDVRSSAAVALGKIGDPRAGPLLRVCARRDERDEVRRAALLALGIAGRAEDIPFLSEVVSDRAVHDDERSMAVLALGLVGGDDAAEWLAWFLERAPSRPEPRNTSQTHFLGTAYQALGLTRSHAAHRLLWRTADDATVDPALRAHAVLGLGRLGDRESLSRCVKLTATAGDTQLKRAAVAALGTMVRADDAQALEALCALTRDRDATTRRFAIASIGPVRSPDVRAQLRRLFADCEDGDRPFVALAIGMQDDRAFARRIRTALASEPNESGRAAYCTTLGLLRDFESIPELERQIGPGPTPGTYRGYAALALAVLPSPDSRDLLWRRVNLERDGRVWGDLSIALGLLGEPRTRKFLSAKLADGDGNYDRCRAASCLGVLRRADAVPELAAIVRDRKADGIVRAHCVVAMGQIADVSPVPRLARLSVCRGSAFATRAIAEAMSIL